MLKRFLALLSILFIFALTACGSTSSATQPVAKVMPMTAVNLDGNWHQVNGGIQNIVMHAVISDDTITINLDWGGATGLFWKGTFVTDNTGTPLTVLSTADSKAMEFQLYSSLDSTKTFTYQDGYLYYPYSVGGVHTTIQLAHNKDQP